MELGRTCFEFTRLKKDGSPYFTSVRQRCIETPERASHRHGARGVRLSINISNERPLRTEGHGFAVLPCERERMKGPIGPFIASSFADFRDSAQG